jgi:hypothetical protein
VLYIFAFILLLFFIIPGISCAEVIKNSIDKQETQAPVLDGRAVSLKVLQHKLLEYQKKSPCPDELLKLVGLKRITGYIVDVANHDVILIGPVDDSLPPLYIEDFVIALRNVWLKYTERRGNIYYHSDPGCSIDPDEKIIHRLDILSQKILRSTSFEEVEKGIKEWHRICQSPQKVRVLGIPFDTRFGWVMVTADYDMKRIVDGYDSLNIPGFSSLTDITLDKAKSDIIQERDVSIPFSSMNRFWFYPGENQYKEDEGVVTIERSQVALLTEEEFQTKKGKIVGTGSPNPLAQRFVESFTAHFLEIAKQRSIYIELENLFHFVALAKIIKLKSQQNEVKLDLSYFLEHFRVQKTPVSQQLPGRSHAKRFEHRKDFSGGYQIYGLWLPSCGGVGININISQSNFSKDTTGNLSTLKATVLKARPSPEALFWDYPLKSKVRLEQEKNRGRSLMLAS